MKIIPTALSEVLLIEPKTFGDARGVFYETFHGERYAEYGLPLNFVQDNFSSSQRNVLRGLHYQLKRPQGKLVGVTYGKVLDVAVDIRRGSPTFGRWISVILDADLPRQLYIPPGFAHGFCVLSAAAHFYYKCTDYYDPTAEQGVAWNDPELNIDWSITTPILSNKDQQYLAIKNIPAELLPTY